MPKPIDAGGIGPALIAGTILGNNVAQVDLKQMMFLKQDYGNTILISLKNTDTKLQVWNCLED